MANNKHTKLHTALNLSILLIAVLILTFTVSLDFLHNHKADFKKHDDCPANYIAMLLSSGIVALPLIFLFLFLLFLLNIFHPTLHPLNLQYYCLSRAPPF